MRDEPCEPWPLSASCLPECWSLAPEKWTEAQHRAVEAAFSVLFKATGRIYGLCPVTVRPCRVNGCPELRGALLPSPALIDGRLYNIPCGCGGECGCGPVCEVPLDGPVHEVVAVKVDGAVVDPATYRVDRTYRGDRLVRVGSAPCWPECQELELPDTEPGTWSVTYRRGAVPGADGCLALTLLAVEFDKLCAGRECSLSSRVTSITREGVSMELAKDAGQTGVEFVDDWIARENPHPGQRPMQAWSPDTVYARRTTWQAPPVPGRWGR